MLYILDGWHFPLMTFLQNNNVYSKRMPPVIMVNVSYGSTPDVMALRARDFTPTKTSRETTSGSAAAFLDFLEHEVIPSSIAPIARFRRTAAFWAILTAACLRSTLWSSGRHFFNGS